MSIRIRIQRGVNTKEEKLHQQIFNSIFQNDIKKSLKINKLNINLSITKRSLILFVQFYIHLMNLYIS